MRAHRTTLEAATRRPHVEWRTKLVSRTALPPSSSSKLFLNQVASIETTLAKIVDDVFLSLVHSIWPGAAWRPPSVTIAAGAVGRYGKSPARREHGWVLATTTAGCHGAILNG
jgi:hypothetical protein